MLRVDNQSATTFPVDLLREMMRVMILLLFTVVMVKTAAASVLGSDVELKPGAEASLIQRAQRMCVQLKLGATQIPSNISSDTRCL